MINVKLDPGKVNTILRKMEELGGRTSHSKIRVAVADAANRAAVSARAAGVKMVRQVYTVKAGQVKKGAFDYKRASAKGDPIEARMSIKGSMLDVRFFSRKILKKRGVFVSIKKDSSFHVPGSFGQTINGHRIAMRRAGRERYPTKGISGPSAPQLFGNPAVIGLMEKQGMEMYEKRLQHALDRIIGGR